MHMPFTYRGMIFTKAASIGLRMIPFLPTYFMIGIVLNQRAKCLKTAACSSTQLSQYLEHNGKFKTLRSLIGTTVPYMFHV